MVEAESRASKVIPAEGVPNTKGGKINLSWTIRNFIREMHQFSITDFDSEIEFNEESIRLRDQANELNTVITMLEERSFRMRQWLPRWFRNKSTKLWEFLMSVGLKGKSKTA